jgi:hypothetical protein
MVPVHNNLIAADVSGDYSQIIIQKLKLSFTEDAFNNNKKSILDYDFRTTKLKEIIFKSDIVIPIVNIILHNDSESNENPMGSLNNLSIEGGNKILQIINSTDNLLKAKVKKMCDEYFIENPLLNDPMKREYNILLKESDSLRQAIAFFFLKNKINKIINIIKNSIEDDQIENLKLINIFDKIDKFFNFNGFWNKIFQKTINIDLLKKKVEEIHTFWNQLFQGTIEEGSLQKKLEEKKLQDLKFITLKNLIDSQEKLQDDIYNTITIKQINFSERLFLKKINETIKSYYNKNLYNKIEETSSSLIDLEHCLQEFKQQEFLNTSFLHFEYYDSFMKKKKFFDIKERISTIYNQYQKIKKNTDDENDNSYIKEDPDYKNGNSIFFENINRISEKIKELKIKQLQEEEERLREQQEREKKLEDFRTNLKETIIKQFKESISKEITDSIISAKILEAKNLKIEQRQRALEEERVRLEAEEKRAREEAEAEQKRLRDAAAEAEAKRLKEQQEKEKRAREEEQRLQEEERVRLEEEAEADAKRLKEQQEKEEQRLKKLQEQEEQRLQEEERVRLEEEKRAIEEAEQKRLREEKLKETKRIADAEEQRAREEAEQKRLRDASAAEEQKKRDVAAEEKRLAEKKERLKYEEERLRKDQRLKEEERESEEKRKREEEDAEAQRLKEQQEAAKRVREEAEQKAKQDKKLQEEADAKRIAQEAERQKQLNLKNLQMPQEETKTSEEPMEKESQEKPPKKLNNNEKNKKSDLEKESMDNKKKALGFAVTSLISLATGNEIKKQMLRRDEKRKNKQDNKNNKKILDHQDNEMDDKEYLANENPNQDINSQYMNNQYQPNQNLIPVQ